MNARALLLIGAIALSACTSDKSPSTEAVPAPAEPSAPATAQASPWEQARTRGIAFRGIGNEPGWLVEVGAGETPALHAELDYGERKIDVAHAQLLAGAPGYAGTTGDGVEVKLQLQRERLQRRHERPDLSGFREAQRGRQDLRGLRPLPAGMKIR